jgi:multisubunit Na+/H+ antiporter MnhE subunit
MSGGVKEESVVSQFVFWIADWATLMAFWIALTGSFRWTELLIGAGASLIGSIASVVADEMTLVRFLPHWQYVWKARSVLWQIPMGVLSVVGAVIRHDGRATGRAHFVPFDPGSENAESQARRAVAETFPTMAPASVVIGVDRGMGVVIFHLLGTTSPPPTLKRLGESG